MTKHLLQEKIHLKSTFSSAGCSLPAARQRTVFFHICLVVGLSERSVPARFQHIFLPTRCLQSYRTLNDGWSAASSLTHSSEGFYTAPSHGSAHGLSELSWRKAVEEEPAWIYVRLCCLKPWFWFSCWRTTVWKFAVFDPVPRIQCGDRCFCRHKQLKLQTFCFFRFHVMSW